MENNMYQLISPQNLSDTPVFGVLHILRFFFLPLIMKNVFDMFEKLALYRRCAANISLVSDWLTVVLKRLRYDTKNFRRLLKIYLLGI